MKSKFVLASLCMAEVYLLLAGSALTARAQVDSVTFNRTSQADSSGDDAVVQSSRIFPGRFAVEAAVPGSRDPMPAEPGAKREEPWTPPDLAENWTVFSRIGVGADISPLGIGIKSATVLTETFDARLEGSFYFYTNGESHIDGVNVHANVHLASVAAKVDWYPMNSVFRISGGLLVFNGNDLSGDLSVNPGSKFSVNSVDYYSANPNPATGATPFTATVDLGLHSLNPAFTLSGGFGRYIPRSHRHWSFPFEIGAIFMGTPSLNVAVGGWVCQDRAQTMCSDLSNPSNPVAISFNNNLQTELTKYRRDLGSFTVYPIFSYGVMYSFNTPW